MGLDTYAARIPVDLFNDDLDETEVDEDFGCTRRDLRAFRRAERKRERHGGGSVFAGNYFRGKIYRELIHHVTGVWIQTTWIPPETVRQMAEAFGSRDPDEVIRRFANENPGHRHLPSDVADLRAFFRVCAERGLGLVGSW